MAPPPGIAICLATCCPQPELFRRQIESIRHQTRTDWLCLINDDATPPDEFRQLCDIVGDDPRFVIEQNPARLGVYQNFERCFERVPAGVEFVACCDQDDVWYPHKLETLCRHCDADTTLVYSDMRIVDGDNRVLASTFWVLRPPNTDDLPSQFLLNTATGTACLFRASLLKTALPFPPQVGPMLHDHWVGCLAMAQGQLRFVPEPLLDYVQHGKNVVGHQQTPPKTLWQRLAGKFTTSAAQPGSLAQRTQTVYTREILPPRLFAGEILRRCPGLPADKQTNLRRIASLDTSVFSLTWLLKRALAGNPKTLNIERRLAFSILWRRAMPWTLQPAPVQPPRSADLQPPVSHFHPAVTKQPARPVSGSLSHQVTDSVHK